MRASLKIGAALGALLLVWEALAVLPGRITIGRHQAQYGRSPVEFAIAGTLRDVSDLALPLGGTAAIVLALVMFARRRHGDTALGRTATRTVAALLAIVGPLLWLASSAAAEFKIQRGVDATRFDVELAARSPALGQTFFRFLFLRRHWVPALVVLAIAALVALVAFRARRRARDVRVSQPLVVLAGFGAATLLGWGASLLPLDPHVRVFRTLSDRHVVGEPFVNLVASLGRSQENVRLGMKGMIEHAEFPSPQSRGGESLLGLPTYAAGDVDCRVHPMARSLPVAGVEAPRPNAVGHHALEPVAARVLVLLDQLSAELNADRSEPIDVWQVMLESFRGDDVHAISSAAPRELAPFVASLYESAERGDGSVIAVRRMWQAGARTSQGLSSYMCGMGMMPYGLSLTRDFGPIPVRCLTDVLADAGFEPMFFFGGPPSFDDMDTFFREHAVREVVGRLQLPLSSPTSEGGVSDRALAAEAIERVAKRSGDRPRYVLMMTSSNHIPYGRPEDVPADVDQRIDALVKSPAFVGSIDDAARLRTFAYADHAISELFAKMGRGLEHTIFVLGADHATGDPFVWQTTPEWRRRPAQGLIPFAIVIPDGLIARTARPARVRELVRELDRALDQGPWSQNDAPLLLLTLLAHAPGVRAMPEPARWHTLGGERTSPFFVPMKSEVKVIGIDCVSELFGTDEADRSLLPPETASFVKEEREIYSSSPSLIPIAATFNRFLNGYAAKCRPELQATR